MPEHAPQETGREAPVANPLKPPSGEPEETEKPSSPVAGGTEDRPRPRWKRARPQSGEERRAR